MSSRGARVLAQAKINLLLRVLGREESGYHSIETVFARLELGDDVAIRLGGRGCSIDSSGADTGSAEQNLAFRAAIAFRDRCGWPAAFSIEIEKRIPVGAGLGGGSADAGAVLRALNSLHAKPLSQQDLLQLAAALGADVPALTTTSPLILAWGRGERMLALNPLPKADVVLAAPEFSVSTMEAFGWLDASRSKKVQSRVSGELTSAMLSSWPGIAEIAANDLEPVVAARHPAIGSLKDALRARGALVAMMSGSGSVVFGVYEPGRGPPSMPDPSAGARWIQTRTASHVVEVERID